MGHCLQSWAASSPNICWEPKSYMECCNMFHSWALNIFIVISILTFPVICWFWFWSKLKYKLIWSFCLKTTAAKTRCYFDHRLTISYKRTMNTVTTFDLRVSCPASRTRYRNHFLCVASFHYTPDYSHSHPPLSISFSNPSLPSFFFFFVLVHQYIPQYWASIFHLCSSSSLFSFVPRDKHDSNWYACTKTCSWWHRAILFSLQGRRLSPLKRARMKFTWHCTMLRQASWACKPLIKR